MSSVPSRVVLIELAGASYDLLVPLAESKKMPNVARLLQTAELSELRPLRGASAWSAWTTIDTGVETAAHGVLDDYYLDHRRARIVAHRAECNPGGQPTLSERVRQMAGSESVAHVADFPTGQSPWTDKPADLEELTRRAVLVRESLHRVVDHARAIDRRDPWRLLRVRLWTLSCVQYHLGNLLGLGDAPGGNAAWMAKTREMLRAVDGCLGRLMELADRRGATVVVISPYGFVPFRERITLSELLRRRDLLRTTDGGRMFGYRMARLGWKAWRMLPWPSPPSRPIGTILPIDWRRSRAVTLHGQSAALVYLNTPERFGGRVLATAASRDQAALEAVASLVEARHPVNDEPLLLDAFEVAKRFRIDTLPLGLPDVIGIPAPGYHARHRLDPKGRLVRADRSLTGTRGGPGLMMVRGPGVPLGQPRTADATAVAPMILNLLSPPSRVEAAPSIASEVER